MIRYFAYGSNMSTARLRERTPGCFVVGVASLPKHILRFHKRSKDGSGKCDAFFNDVASDAILGVLFDIPENEKHGLDAAEGLGNGYDEQKVVVLRCDGRLETAVTYMASASAIDTSLRPTDCYKEFVLSGAREHDLPDDYIREHILNVPTCST